MLHIDKDLCIGCGICEDQCAFGAITVVEGKAVVGDTCTLCGACVEACDVGALVLDRHGKKRSDGSGQLVRRLGIL